MRGKPLIDAPLSMISVGRANRPLCELSATANTFKLSCSGLCSHSILLMFFEAKSRRVWPGTAFTAHRQQRRILQRLACSSPTAPQLG